MELRFDVWDPRLLEKILSGKDIENYFFLLKSTKSTKTTCQKCRRNIIWADFVGHPYRTNGIKTHLGLPAAFSPFLIGKTLTQVARAAVFEKS